MELLNSIIAESVSGLVGIFLGTLAALAVDRYNERRRTRQRAKLILRSLAQELTENFATLKNVKSAYVQTAFGKSFYLSTLAWETAMASGDLPAIIGYELADDIALQYALLVRIRYYVDLLTRLWLAPKDIEGYEDIRRGFSRAIVDAMDKAIGHHPHALGKIGKALE